MHEGSVCRTLLAQVLAIHAREQAKAVRAIRIQAGVLSGFDAGHIVEAFAHVAAGTAAEGARVDVELVPLRVHCPDCGADSAVGAERLDCPACGCTGTTLIDGAELRLVDIELTLPGVAAHGSAS